MIEGDNYKCIYHSEPDNEVKGRNITMLKKLLPMVKTSHGTVEIFNFKKIYESLLKETELSAKEADKITEILTRRLIASGIKTTTAPLIREMACSIMYERGDFINRSYYTRLGDPYRDAEKLINDRTISLGAKKDIVWGKYTSEFFAVQNNIKEEFLIQWIKQQKYRFSDVNEEPS